MFNRFWKALGRYPRRILRTIAGSVLLIILLVKILDYGNRYRATFRHSDARIMEIFAERHLTPTIKYYTTHGRKLRYIEIGNDSLPTVLFIHGAPSSMTINYRTFRDSLMLSKFKMIGVDRPGYGYSDLGNAETSIAKQAAMFKPLLDSLGKRKRPIIVAGFSFGGPIACKIAMDYPELVGVDFVCEV